ncbi:MAG: ATP-dependent zinc metalloprotease FtsH [Candidatus Ratteibacteria bacterium]|nr:ATP-dependent zinc metalloprotease FtsH [Candidatus Ratteibacteria bacterium]
MSQPKKTDKPKKLNLILGLIFFLGLLIIFNNFSQVLNPSKEVIFSEFMEAVEKGEVLKVIIVEDNITGEFTDGKAFKTYAPPDPELIKILRSKKVEIKAEPESVWRNILFSFFPFLLFILFFWFLIRRQFQGGGKVFNFGKSQAKLHSESATKVTFADVAGVEEAKEELQEVISFLKDPKKFQKLGGRIPKGVLLMGPPGSGKTLLAKAVAGEAQVPFFSISGSDFVEMFVGVGASRVRDLFDIGRKNAPCILFIDEIDAVGRLRFAGLGGGHDEREQTLNQLLAEMDGFNTQEGVILLASTNRPDVLDPALLRPGRFDRQIVVNQPDLIGREAILKVHSKNVVLDKNVDLKVIARQTSGFSGADLANLVNEAALLAARKDKKAVEVKEMEEAIERVMAGPERKSRILSDRERKIVAYHESGHSLLSLLIPEVDSLHKVSIIPRGIAALGYTMQLASEDRYIYTKDELLGKITVLLGGRAAEMLIFKQLSTGAQNDLNIVTEAAHRMVCEFGMSEKLGNLTLGRKDSQVFLGRDIVKEKNYSEETARKIDTEVRKIIDECYGRAGDLLKENKDKLEKLARTLLEKEVLTSEEVKHIIGYEPKKDRETRS